MRQAKPGRTARRSGQNVDGRTLGFKCGEYKANVEVHHAPNHTDSGMTETPYLIPDLLAPKLKLVFCGSALGFESARQKAYYAKPGNKFWPTLHAVGLTPRLFRPAEYPDLLQLGIGLTDLNKRQSGNDTDLSAEHDDVAGLVAKIETYQPALLAFTAKRPAQVFLRARCDLKGPPAYGLQAHHIGRTQFFVLPSTSGSGVRYWDIAPWQELKRLTDQLQ